MNYVDPHIHMVSRVTDDYEALARMGCVAVSEPAFWAGFDRRSADGFRDYFRQITEVEPKRAAGYGIAHYSWLCINAKEAEDVTLARDVIAAIPEFLGASNVLGIGEIGLNKNTRNEATVFLEQVQLAVKHDETILIHTPHLADKLRDGCRPSATLCADARYAGGPARTNARHDHPASFTRQPLQDRNPAPRNHRHESRRFSGSHPTPDARRRPDHASDP